MWQKVTYKVRFGPGSTPLEITGSESVSAFRSNTTINFASITPFFQLRMVHQLVSLLEIPTSSLSNKLLSVIQKSVHPLIEVTRTRLVSCPNKRTTMFTHLPTNEVLLGMETPLKTGSPILKRPQQHPLRDRRREQSKLSRAASIDSWLFCISNYIQGD